MGVDGRGPDSRDDTVHVRLRRLQSWLPSSSRQPPSQPRSLARSLASLIICAAAAAAAAAGGRGQARCSGPRPGHGQHPAGRNDEYGRQFLDCLIEPRAASGDCTADSPVSQGAGVATTWRCWRPQAISGPDDLRALPAMAPTVRSAGHRRVIEYVDFASRLSRSDQPNKHSLRRYQH